MRTCGENKCFWPVWGTDKKTGIGYCKFHQHKRTDTDKRTPFEKHMAKMKEQEKIVTVSEEDLKAWFDDKVANSKRECENCGKSLRHYTKKDFRGSQHHVLEKSLYPSVATNPINHLVLCKWECHSLWHVSWEKASQMKIFPKALDIINQLYPLLTREEKGKLTQIEIVAQEIRPEVYNK